MLFFDSNSWFIHNELNNDIEKLEDEKKYYQNEIKKDSKEIKKLSTDEGLEKFGREKYNMKKENEEEKSVLRMVSSDGHRLSIMEKELDKESDINIEKNEKITPAELIIAKHRNGPLGIVELSFQTDPTKFFDTFRNTE